MEGDPLAGPVKRERVWSQDEPEEKKFRPYQEEESDEDISDIDEEEEIDFCDANGGGKIFLQNLVKTLTYSGNGNIVELLAPSLNLHGTLIGERILGTPFLTEYSFQSITNDALGAFKSLFDDSMLLTIKECTEFEARRRLGHADWTVDVDELEAVFGLLFLRGTYSSHISVFNLFWSHEWGVRFFRETMTLKRLKQILVFLRLGKGNGDDAADGIWNAFMENNRRCYRPSPKITIEEQSLPLKRRSGKKGASRLEFWLAIDEETDYIVNGLLKQEKHWSKSVDQETATMLKIIEPFFFQADPLGETKTSVFSFEKIDLLDGIILKYPNCMLNFYGCKPVKKQCTLDKPSESTSDFVFRNCGSCEVGKTRRMLKRHSTRCGAGCWQAQILYSLLDVAGTNAWTLHCLRNGVKKSRRTFQLELARELCMRFRARGGPKAPPQAREPKERQPDRRKTCKVGLCKGNKTSIRCRDCGLPGCGQCGEIIKMYVCRNCKGCGVPELA